MTISTDIRLDTQPTTPTRKGRHGRRLAVVSAGVALALSASACFITSASSGTSALRMRQVAAGTASASSGRSTSLRGSSGTPRSNGPVSTGSSRTRTLDLHRPGQFVQGADTGSWSNMDDFMTYVIQSVDSYWSPVMVAAGQPEPNTGYVFPLPGQVMSTPCGNTSDTTAMYCPQDNNIYFSQAWAVSLWNGTWTGPDDQTNPGPGGDMAPGLLLAHEYAHSMQNKLGILDGRFTVPQTEQHADCWAGVWMKHAQAGGILDPNDVQEAVNVDFLVGDSNLASPHHHGTPDQRVKAFDIGYGSGTPTSCDAILQSGPDGLS